MSVEEGLESAGRFLVGDISIQPGWLQNTLSSISPQGDFLCLAKGQNFILYRSRWIAGKLELKLEVQDTVSVLQEDEEITSLAVFPVLSTGRLQSISNYVVLGFSSGIVRLYTESAQLIIQKCFHPTPVRQIKFQSMPEGKHSTNILFTQSMQEMLIVYENVLVSVAAVDLLDTISKNTEDLASTMAQGLETAHLINLKGHKLLIKDQKVTDSESFVFTNTSYNQYFQLTMQGGLVDDRYKPVTTKPYFLTVGQEPFLQYNEKGFVSVSAGELAQNVVSTVKSGFFRVASGALGSLWSTGSETEQKEPPDPQSNLSISHSLKDSGRDGLEVLISPNKMYSAVKDSQNRILLVGNNSRTVVQMWRGYHRCQMGWALATSQKQNLSGTPQPCQDAASVLILYMPRRGLVEVWSPEQKVKVTQFHVSKHGTLLRSGGVCLDDGLPRKHDLVKVFTSFLHPDGRICHFYIPFHALSISSTAEKDANTHRKIVEQLNDDKGTDFNEVFSLLEEIRNLQLKSLIIFQLLIDENYTFTLPEVTNLLERLVEVSSDAKKSQSLEQKIFASRIIKLRLLINFYALGQSTEMEEDNTSVSNRQLMQNLSIAEEEGELLMKAIQTIPAEEEDCGNMSLSDFIQCFDIEGELKTNDRASVRIKKELSPKLSSKLGKLFCSVISTGADRQSLMDSGISTVEILQTILMAFLKTPGYFLANLPELQSTLQGLLSMREGFDDRTVSNLQDVSKRILLKSRISRELWCIICLWMNCLKLHGSFQIYVDEWARRLVQASSFIDMLESLSAILDESVTFQYTLSDVFDSGNGRISEIVCRWLIKLKSSSKHIVSSLDGFKETTELALVSSCARYFPLSMDSNILLVHLCWEELQVWQRDRDELETLETALISLSDLTCFSLRVKFSHLIWRSFFAKYFREIARRTEDFRKSNLNESAICEKEFGIRRENIPSLLSLLLSFLDKSLDLLRLGEPDEIVCDYDSLSMNKQLHLLDHIKNTDFPDIEMLSLEHQVASVLFLTWRLKLPSRPLKLFNSVEINNLLNIQSTAVVSWFSDYNANVKKERLLWIELVTETSSGHIHRLTDNRLELDQYRKLIDITYQLGKVWFISEDVRINQCQFLYKAGFDTIAAEIRGNVLEKGKLAEKLLEISLLRLAKYLHQDADSGRLAAIPSDILTEVSARSGKFASVADSSLADNLALLLWLTDALEREDFQLLATQCVSAVQVMQVRRNRTGV